MLIFSSIDIMAWLDRPESHDDVTQEDFRRWVDTYLLPTSQLSCTADDLYAARCGWLHACSPESSLSRKGKARPIFYAWGSASEDILRQAVQSGNWAARVVHVDTLCNALRTAIDRFLDSIEDDRERRQLLGKRMAKQFTNVPVTNSA